VEPNLKTLPLSIAVLSTLLFSSAIAHPPEFHSSDWMKDVGVSLKSYEKDLKANKAVPAAKGSNPSDHIIRCYYLIPSNRTQQSTAVKDYQNAMLLIQDWYADQMEANGFGRKTFEIETEPDGITPKINIINSSNPDTTYHANPWSSVAADAAVGGFPHWTSGEVMMSIYEAHQQLNPATSSQAYLGAFNGGGSFGSGNDPGVGMTGSLSLTFLGRDFLTDNTVWHGNIYPQIGPYALVDDFSFAWFEGETHSEASSVQHGVILHELSHGFGQAHDFRNDGNFNGNMMGNGLRGVRGWSNTINYDDHFARLSYSVAQQMNINRYFNTGTTWTDNTKPTLSITTTSPTSIQSNGKVSIVFSGSDTSGLALAHLRHNGVTVDTIDLGGATNVSDFFETSFYETTSTNNYEVALYDTQSNLSIDTLELTVTGSGNRAPRPHFLLNPGRVHPGESVTLDAGGSIDPGEIIPNLMYEWDLDGDNVYDTAPSSSSTLDTSWSVEGNYLVRLRVTDPNGASTESQPIGVIVSNDPPAIRDVDSINSHVDGFEFYLY